MDTILLATMILLTPFMGMWAFILSESKAEGPSPEDIQDLPIGYLMQKAVQGCALTPEQEAISALNRIRDILLRPEGQSLEEREIANQSASLRTVEDYR